MITLYGYGPAFGLPDPSPFVTKAEVLLKMAGQPYVSKRTDLKTNPKGKIPYLIDDGVLVPDSTLVRLHLEKKYSVDFDAGASRADIAAGWAFEKMCEDHLYWPLLIQRWMDDGNFARGPATLFAGVPALIRPMIVAMVRRRLRRDAHGHGFGRYSQAEGQAIVARAFRAIADFLDGRGFLGGAHPIGADATLFAFLAGSVVPTIFEGYYSDEAAGHPVLRTYVERMGARFYPNGFSS